MKLNIYLIILLMCSTSYAETLVQNQKNGVEQKVGNFVLMVSDNKSSSLQESMSANIKPGKKVNNKCTELARPSDFSPEAVMKAIYCQYDSTYKATLFPLSLNFA